MIEKIRGTKRPITLRRVLTTSAVLLLFALVLVTPAAAAENWLDKVDTSWYADPSKPEFTITTAEQLAGLAQLVNGGTDFAGKTIILGNDINLAGKEWPGIGVYKTTNSFSGIFDGDGWKISKMTFADNSGKSYAAGDPNNYRGLFNLLIDATVKDLTVEGYGFGTVTSAEHGGAIIAGHAKNSLIENCIAEGSIEGNHNVAGIAVRLEDATIKGCTNNADVTGSYSKMGGIAALVQSDVTGSKIIGCVNEGDITSTARGEDGVGGIVGWIGYPNTGFVTVENCENKGQITATSTATVGQIAAESWSGDNVFSGNKGLTTIAATGHSPMNGLNFATVTGGVAYYTKDLTPGNTYLVTAKITDVSTQTGDPIGPAKPGIKLGSGESITFDTTLASFDDTGITSVYGLQVDKTTGENNLVTYTAPVVVASIGKNYYPTLQAAIEAAGDGATITLLDDITEPGITVAVGKNVVIDLDQHTVTGSFVVYGTAEIKNGKIDSTVCGKSGLETNNEADRTLNPTLIVSDLIINSGRHAIRVDGGTVTINSGTYTAYDAASHHAINISSGGKVTIIDGTFIGNTQSGSACIAVRDDGSQVTINGGTFRGGYSDLGSLTVWGGTATVNGGTFETVYANVAITITGGTFSSDSDYVKNNLADDHVLIESAGKYVVKNFQTAVNEAAPGATITVVSNGTLTNGLTIAADDKIALDLGKNTINGSILSYGILSVKGGIIESKTFVSSIESNGASAELTLEDVTATSQRHALRIDGGKATIIRGTYTALGYSGSTTHALNAGGEGTTDVIIKDGTFKGIKDNNNNQNKGDSGSAVSAQNGATVTIEKGSFSGGLASTISVSKGSTGTISITGGIYDQDPSAFVKTKGYAAFPNDAGTSWEVKEGWIITWVDEDGNVLEKKPVEANTNPVFTGTVPTKQGDEKYTYRFDNIWTPTVGPAVKEETYRAVYTPVPVPYTLTFETGDGASTIAPITQGYGTEIDVPENPTKAGYSFAGWKVDGLLTDVPTTMPAQNMIFVAEWKQTDYPGFVYTLGTVPESICVGDTLLIPIDFTNKEREAVPDVWYINVMVSDAKGPIDVKKLEYDLTVAPGYAGVKPDDGFGYYDGEPNEFVVTGGSSPAKGTVKGLFTITIKNLETAAEKYTVTINILSGVPTKGDEHTEAPTLLTTQVLVQDQVSMINNFYSANDGHEQWSLDTQAWAKITIENNLKDGETQLTTKQLNTLVTRGHFALTLLGSGDYVVFKDDGTNAPEEITPTPVITTDANGYLVLDVTGHQDAEKFIIEFTGRKVGDVSNLPSKPDRVDGADSSYMIKHFTENLIKDEYLVYGDIDMDGSIGTLDATYAYLKGVNKLEKVYPGEEQKFLLVKKP